MVRYEDENKTPVTPEQILLPVVGRINRTISGQPGSGSGEYDKRWIIGAKCLREKYQTRAITGIDGDIRINKALWVMPNSSESGSHDNISKAPEKFRALLILSFFGIAVSSDIPQFINWLFGCL